MGVSMRAMPRTPVAATARLDRISVRATESELQEIDRMRGSMSISDFIRSLVVAAAESRRAIAMNPPEETP